MKNLEKHVIKAPYHVEPMNSTGKMALRGLTEYLQFHFDRYGISYSIDSGTCLVAHMQNLKTTFTFIVSVEMYGKLKFLCITRYRSTKPFSTILEAKVTKGEIVKVIAKWGAVE